MTKYRTSLWATIAGIVAIVAAGAPAMAQQVLMMLVHHDDAQREFAYGADSKIGTFSDSLMTEAKSSGWTVISMKSDWGRVFAFENN